MAEIKLSDEQTREIIKEALLAKIDDRMAAELVRDAVSDLVRTKHYGSPTELQQQFRAAANEVARQMIREEFDKPETRDKIRALIVDAWEHLLEKDNRDKLVEQMSSGLARALFGREY